MSDETPTEPQASGAVYEAPQILWEHEFTALAACSPPCTGDDICINDFCIPRGG